MIESFDAIVLGAGEAGAVLATRAVAAGGRIAMVYRAPYGSVCLNAGCVASKFLIHRAKVAHVIRTAPTFHIAASAPRVDLRAIVAEKNSLIERNRAEAYNAAAGAERLTLLEGEARFLSRREIAVNDRTLKAERVFIATGMRPAMPNIPGLAAAVPLTSDNAMDLIEIPKHLVCIGGSYVGCELAQAFARFGATVTILEIAEHLVPSEEPDVSTVLERAFAKENIEVVLGANVTALRRENRSTVVTFESDAAGRREITASHVLVATGRTPNTDTLDLGMAGVKTDTKGFVKVNERLETTAQGIWAIGDVNGQQPFTRVCQEEAKIAYANAFEDGSVSINRTPLGHAIFTDPEIASVGLTERQARDEGRDIIAGLVTFEEVEKAQLIGETSGFIKYVAERASRRIMGCHVIGPGAADLIYPVIVTMRREGTLHDLALAVGIFPTLEEGMEGTARAVLRRVAPGVAGGPLAAIQTRVRNSRPEHASRIAKLHLNREETMAKEGNFSCAACGAEFNSREQLDQHNNREHGGRSGAGTTGTTGKPGTTTGTGRTGGSNPPPSR